MHKGKSQARRPTGVVFARSPKRMRLINNNNIFSPTELARKLDLVDPSTLNNNDPASVELKNFECGVTGTYEDYQKRRQQIRSTVADPEHFDANGRTALNIEGAAIAGAKLLVDERRSTRSMCKQLRERCGIEQDDILYKPLGYDGSETSTVKETYSLRQASVMESLVDYKKQIAFKSQILNIVDATEKEPTVAELRKKRKEEMELEEKKAAEGRLTRGKAKRNRAGFETPHIPRNFDPLDENMILEKYAEEVAAEVRRNSLQNQRLPPIPINFDLLDSDEDTIDETGAVSPMDETLIESEDGIVLDNDNGTVIDNDDGTTLDSDDEIPVHNDDGTIVISDDEISVYNDDGTIVISDDEIYLDSDDETPRHDDDRTVIVSEEETRMDVD